MSGANSHCEVGICGRCSCVCLVLFLMLVNLLPCLSFIGECCSLALRSTYATMTLWCFVRIDPFFWPFVPELCLLRFSLVLWGLVFYTMVGSSVQLGGKTPPSSSLATRCKKISAAKTQPGRPVFIFLSHCSLVLNLLCLHCMPDVASLCWNWLNNQPADLSYTLCSVHYTVFSFSMFRLGHPRWFCSISVCFTTF